MAIPNAVRANFNTMLQAAKDGRLALMECTRKDNGEPVDVIVAVSDSDDGEGYDLIPFGYVPRDHVIYDLVDPPGD